MIRLRSSVLRGVLQAASARDLWPALQQAIELEHATIPPYLYALYSLDPSNSEIAAILQSVVAEEMLHMTLASNVLNALGGSPAVDRPGFIPKYPGPLPGGVQGELTVHLAPFSMAQLEAFLQIEEPEDPLRFRSFTVMETLPDEITIGEFYTAILHAIKRMGDGAFVEAPRNQIGPDVMARSVIVSGVATARVAITTIIDQGEGTRTSPLEVAGTGYAHYYRYMQIRKGYLLVRNAAPDLPPDRQYTFTGAPVPFNPGGVYAVPADPSSATYPPGSAQAFANDNFNYTYTALLAALQTMFNGSNTKDQFNRAIGLMMSLKEQAMAMMSGIPNPALFIGPSFEYLPVNPSL